MKNGFFPLAAILFAFFMIAATNPSHIDSIPVKPGESVVEWVGHKVTGKHRGTIGIKSGQLDFDHGAFKGGKFVIDMGTITVTDLSGGGKNKLEGHLNSDDFFGVAKHPTATLVCTKVSPKGTPGDYKITGDLTIKGITKEVRFYTNVKKDGGKFLATADITIDRSDFDIRYGSGSFFDNLGDKTIYDEFDLKVALTAQK